MTQDPMEIVATVASAIAELVNVAAPLFFAETPDIGVAKAKLGSASKRFIDLLGDIDLSNVYGPREMDLPRAVDLAAALREEIDDHAPHLDLKTLRVRFLAIVDALGVSKNDLAESLRPRGAFTLMRGHRPEDDSP